MYELMVESSFDSAHNLRGYEGPCESLHGHTYRVRAYYAGPELDELGMLIDFKKLKGALLQVVADLDHRYLNELPYFTETNPTAENLAKHIFGRMREAVGAGIMRVSVWETPTSRATYSE
ncbi:MAG: 6-carboxytetrahydropterin synthase QueD [Armatimonadota bacterium]